LQEAERSTSIESLPPTLHLSLLRFVYDPKSGTRKKSKALLKFPPEIQMKKYMRDVHCKHDEDGVKYVLTAVVEHMGPSVSCGGFKNQYFRDRLKVLSMSRHITATLFAGYTMLGLSWPAKLM
jgi:ubiquitin carboxyl-terminal hydrolase 48